ncbi:MAG: hypothetical protein EBW68_07735, partial [Actinobacteria bacterium]|nr:hypothetical protein [Actinomycetota bacterium]
MSRLRHRFLVALATFSLAGFVAVVPAIADSPVGTCNSGTVVTATLKVDGAAVVVNASGSAYALTVCRVTSNSYYTVQVGLYDGGVLKEDLLATNLEKTFEVTFAPTAGDTPTVADFYGRIQSYSVGTNVVVSVKPVALTKVNYSLPANAALNCGGKEFTDAACIALAGVDKAAMVTGTVRFDTSTRASSYSKLAGATVSASANLYDISLSGPCPLASSSYSGNDGGGSRPSSETTTLTAKMVGPHFKENGTTLNTGSLEVFIPKETITACFGGTATELATSLGITRTEAGVTADVVKTSGAPSTGLQYTTTVIGDALKISVSAVSFSDPTYNLLLHKAAVATTTTVPSSGATTTTSPGNSATTTTVVNGGASTNLTTLIQTNAASTTQLSRTTGRTAKSLAAQANLAVLTGSTVSLKVVASTAKYCKVTGTNIKG